MAFYDCYFGYGGFNVEPIYRQLYMYKMSVVIPYNIRNEGENLRFEEHFRPNCVREHSYCNDNFDEIPNPQIQLTKVCALFRYTMILSFKRFKNMITDVQKFTYPASGSELLEHMYKKRTSVKSDIVLCLQVSSKSSEL